MGIKKRIAPPRRARINTESEGGVGGPTAMDGVERRKQSIQGRASTLRPHTKDWGKLFVTIRRPKNMTPTFSQRPA